MVRIDPSTTDGVDPFQVQPASTPLQKHPLIRGISGAKFRKGKSWAQKGICFFSQIKQEMCLSLS